MTRPLVLVVAAALYNAKGEILLAQRPEGKSMAGLWEFPGGKVEPGETPVRALVRELQEFHLLMPLFRCLAWAGEVIPAEGQAVAWVAPSSLHDYPAPAADIPLFDVLSGK